MDDSHSVKINFKSMLVILALPLISNAQSLKSIAPNLGILGQSLPVTITGMNTLFTVGTSSTGSVKDVYFERPLPSYYKISATSFSILSDTSVSAMFSIPLAAVIGYYDVHVNTHNQGNLKLTNGFLILVNSIEDEEISKYFDLYPNPSVGNLNLRMKLKNKTNEYNVKVFNSEGKTIFSRKMKDSPDDSFNFDFTEQTPGIYFLSIHIDGKTLTKKFVIQK